MNNSINNKNLKVDSFNWNIVQNEMKDKLGLDVYESWLKKINFLEEFNNYILLSVPTRFIRDWITSRYLDQIIQIVKIHKKEITRVEFKIIEQKSSQNNQFKDTAQTFEKTENISFIKDSYLQYNRIDPNKRFDNFLT